LIFSKVNNSWGSFYYDEKEDALRVVVKNETLDKSVEWLKYEFINQTDNAATVAMSWERRMIPFKIEADTKKLQMEAFRSDFRTTRPYYDFLTAANWCLNNNYELEQALAWVDRAIYFRVMGEKNFRSLMTKATILIKLSRPDEAKLILAEALPMGLSSMGDVHYYGRQLLNLKQNQEALKFFKANYDKYPNNYVTTVGLGRGYSALGDYKKALTYMKAALPLAPDEFNKASIEGMIKTLQEGKDVN
jgi:tetratricopeptide (TPR) repeat protein